VTVTATGGDGMPFATTHRGDTQLGAQRTQILGRADDQRGWRRRMSANRLHVAPAGRGTAACYSSKVADVDIAIFS